MNGLWLGSMGSLRSARSLSIWIVLLVLGAFLSDGAAAQAYKSQATAAFVYDQSSGIVLFEKAADEPMPPASMSKLMTLYMAFEAIADGRLRLDERLPVSQHAMDYAGSTMFLNIRDRVSVEDLLRGIIVLSGNDACAVIAEALSPDGSERDFARLMTERGRQLGLKNSTFVNSNGWPAPQQRMSMRDLGILADRLIRDFPTYYPLFSEQKFAFDGRAPENSSNRNPLLGIGIGVDGLKTGHTREAGYGLVGSAKSGDRRVIFVITGLPNARARAVEAEKIVTWALRQFSQKKIGDAGERVASLNVWMGASDRVDLALAQDVSVLVPFGGEGEAKVEISMLSPQPAPIAAGDKLAELIVVSPGLPETRYPLVAAESVAAGGLVSRFRTAPSVLLRKFGAGGAGAAAGAAGG